MTTAATSTDANFFSRYAARGGGGGGGKPGERGTFRSREPIGKLFDRQPPSSPEAELSLLGSMILDHRVIGDVIQLIRGGEVFYDPNNGIVFECLVQTYDKHQTGDLTQLKQALEDRGVLEQVGGVEFLVRLAEETPVAVNAVHYARIVADKHRLRRLIDAAGEILYSTYHQGAEQEAAAVIDAAERTVFEIAEEEGAGEVQALGQLLEVEVQRLEAKQRGEAMPTGVRTGFHELDGMLGGLQPGEMIIIAARPSMGKTSFVLNIAEQIALGTDGPRQPHATREPDPIGVFSLEMSRQALVQRLLSSYTGINSRHIQRSVLAQAQHHELVMAAERLGEATLFIDDTPSMTITQLRARARRMVARHGVKAILVDYLQLLSAPAAARENRQVEVGAISRGIKALARDLKIPIVALSQLNRGPEARDHNRPRLSDLRESGSLEQDADVVMLLHREEYYHLGEQDWMDENPDKIGMAEVIIAKQRNGPTGTVRLTWDAHTTRFKNFAGGEEYGIGASVAAGSAGGGGAPPGVGSRGGGHGAAGFVEPAPRPARPSFAPGRSTGPVEGHRDGGGPEREPPSGPSGRVEDAEDEGDEPAPF